MKYVIIGHGKYPSGTKSTLKFLSGADDKVSVIEENVENNDYQQKIDKLFSENLSESIMIFSDLPSGAASQYAMKKLKVHDFKMITGFNIALLLEIILTDNQGENLESIVKEAQDQIVYVNDLFCE